MTFDPEKICGEEDLRDSARFFFGVCFWVGLGFGVGFGVVAGLGWLVLIWLA